jgi:hypothetical protein
VAHGWNDNAFYAWKVTPAGIDSAVVSNVGIVHSDAVIQNSYGQLKFNTCGDRLAVAAGYLDKVEFFDFDVETGVVSNPQTISYSDHVYGVEFSPNGDVLYVSTYETSGTLLQYDLSLANIGAIVSAVQIVSTTSDIYPLQRAVDGKIYVCKSFSQFLGVIQSPNSIGSLACDYIDNAIDLDPSFIGASSGIGLPNFVCSFMGGASACPGANVGLNEQGLSAGSVSPNPSESTFTFKAGTDLTTVCMLDASGKLLETHMQIVSGTELTFGSEYAPGVYFIKVADEAGNTDALRIVKID